MKCPKCGHWNKDTLPRCFKCGENLNARAQMPPGWQREFQQPRPKARREVYDDTVEPVEDIVAPMTEEEKQQAESLAAEMARLKDRRARGSAYLENIRRENAATEIRGTSAFFEEDGEEGEEAAGEEEDVNEPPVPAMPGEDIPSIKRRRRAPRSEVTRSNIPPEGMDVYLDNDPDLPADFDAVGYIAPATSKKRRRRRVRGPMLLAYILVFALALTAVAFGIYAAVSAVIPSFVTQRASTSALENVDISAIDIGNAKGHKIVIPGEEGTQIYIAELLKSYVVVGGVATIEVADHQFYSHLDPLEISSMEVELTPTIVGSGRDTRMSPIRYTIDIPQTEITIISPAVNTISVYTATYNMELIVTPGSKLYINGEDKSDTVRDDGTVYYTSPVQAIGDNVITILARAPYCRDRTEQVILYREPMEIPLELDAATLSYVSTEDLTIHATTQVGATITVETPTFWVNPPDDTGTFSISAQMTRVGNNSIVIRASYPGKADSVLEHIVYYLPPPETYTPKAWALSAQDYSELMNNIARRIEIAQIYLCKGTVIREVSKTPQLVVMDTGTDGREQLVMLENGTRDGTVWEVGKEYRVYADVSGVYNTMPRMVGRYSYQETSKEEDEAEAQTDQADQADGEPQE